MLQPLNGFRIEVVGRFVQQQDVRRIQQQFAERNTPLLAAGKFGDLGIRLGAAQRIHRLFDLAVEVPQTGRVDLVLQRRHFIGGSDARVVMGADETAFGDRSAPFIMNLLANWTEPSADAANISWVRGLFQKLRPAMKPGVHINFMSGDEQDRVPEAYHQRWDRMVAVKSHYDPKNFFRLNQNVPPRNAAAKRP